jgi:hypothetical protein
MLTPMRKEVAPGLPVAVEVLEVDDGAEPTDDCAGGGAGSADGAEVTGGAVTPDDAVAWRHCENLRWKCQLGAERSREKKEMTMCSARRTRPGRRRRSSPGNSDRRTGRT